MRAIDFSRDFTPKNSKILSYNRIFEKYGFFLKHPVIKSLYAEISDASPLKVTLAFQVGNCARRFLQEKNWVFSTKND